MKSRKCTYWFPDLHKRCNTDVVSVIKVRTYHFMTGRTTTQTWYFCETHSDKLLSEDLSRWGYYHGDKLIANIIEIISVSEYYEYKM